MRILFLDDNPERHRVFGRTAAGHAVDHAYTAAEAIAFLRGDTYEVVYLDHDLGGPESEGLILDGVEDGRFVAHWIAEHAHDMPGTFFVVHSLNFAGAEAMMALLRGVGLEARRIPFAWTMELRIVA